MGNTLDFHITYNRLESLNFIQRFATAYTFLETSKDSAGNACNPDISGLCFCGNPDCKKDEAAAIRCKFFFLLNTMCGNSAIRCHFDGRPTDMQRLVGDTCEEGHGCGSDFVVDFLFGYTGYDYRRCTNAAAFKEEIVAAIDAGKPIIAKLKSGEPRFYLISGYDGDALVCPDFTIKYWDFEKNEPVDIGTDGPPAYQELDTLILFGDKGARRYTLKDGLMNIRRAMECNIRERVLDGYLTKLGGFGKYASEDGFDKASPEERKARALRLAETVLYIYNICSFDGAFHTGDKPHAHDLHIEMSNPALTEFWNRIDSQQRIILESGHKFGGFSYKDWQSVDPSELPGISAGICDVIEDIKKADMELLEIINQAIGVLEKQ